MNDKKQLFWVGGAFIALLGLFAISRTGSIPNQATGLKGVALSTLNGSTSVDLGSCAAVKCLNVYVSPWCTVCQKSTGFITALREYLRERGVPTRVIVGRGRAENIKTYAPSFGPDVLVDFNETYPLQGGVPNFAVSTPAGEVIKVIAGVPGIYKEPFPEGLMSKMADYLEIL